MNPDQVIKEAIEKFAIARHDAFILGAYQTFKKAGASDEEATELVKTGAFMARKLLAGAAKGKMPLGEGQLARGLPKLTQDGAIANLSASRYPAARAAKLVANRGTPAAIRHHGTGQWGGWDTAGETLKAQAALRANPTLTRGLNKGFTRSAENGFSVAPLNPESRLRALQQRLLARAGLQDAPLLGAAK